MNSMLPFDGSGYGQSCYWINQAKDIGAKNGEKCGCWDENEPVIKFLEADPFHLKIICHKKKDTCRKMFAQTENELTTKFLLFYKG